MAQSISQKLSQDIYNADNEKKSSSIKKRKYSNALPSKEEQMHLRETANLMQSNFLNLQVDELLHETDYDFIGEQQSVKKIKKWVEEFQFFLQSLDTRRAVSEINLGDFFESLNYKIRKEISFTFYPPKICELIGSFETKTLTKPFCNIDIGIMIPNECFEARFF